MPLLRIHVCFFLFVFVASGIQSFIHDGGTTVNISRLAKGSSCKVCTEGRQNCEEALLLKGGNPVSVEFSCPQPEDEFKVEIIQNIECTIEECGWWSVPVSTSWLDFHRRFTWNLKASRPKSVQVDFPETGMRQIPPSEKCPEGHTYTFKAFQKTESVVIGKYCTTGPIRSIQILNQGSFSLDVPPGLEVQSDDFTMFVGEDIKSLAKVTLSLSHGTYSSELLSPNFPESFPDDDVMEWYFELTNKQRAAIEFLNLTEPRCLKKETAAEYHNKGRLALVTALTDVQPLQSQGDFSLILRNCEMDRRRAGSPGLSVKLKVTALRMSAPVICSVDLKKIKYLSLHLERLNLASECEMKMDSVIMEKITIPSGEVSQLTFQDCLPQDISVTASGVIGCSQFKDCPKFPVRLTVPFLPSCLPSPLNAVTWALRPPPHGTVELTSLMGPLKQALPDQLCDDSLISLTEDDGKTVGHFCPLGAIQKVQIHTNVSVTVTRMGNQNLRSSVKPLLTASLKEEITERYIFTLSPKRDTSLLLATPGWPAGMESYATISWIVSLPPKMEAHLKFVHLSQPKCANRHTNIQVQTFGSLEEDYSRREDEAAEEVTVTKSFYLNMSNCMTERGEFMVVTELTVQKNQLLIIILSVVAALVLLFIAVLVAVCIIIKKKKKKINHQVSIYNPNGTIFLPGNNGFPKSREDNESHVYASIEDTLVYTHLLRKGAEMGIYTESNMDDPYTETTDSPLSKDENIETGVYQEYPQQGPPLPNRPPSHGHTLVDNVIYEAQPTSATMEARLDPEGGN